MPNKLILGNSLKKLKEFPDGMFDAIVTDPPYFTTNLKFDQDKFDWQEVWADFKRIIKPNGIVIIFGQMRSAIEVINANPKWFRYEIVWEKTMPTGFLDAKVRPLRNHELILVFAKSLKNTTYNPQKEKGIPYQRDRSGVAQHYAKTSRIPTLNNGDRFPKDTIKFSNHNHQSPHPTAKPVELIKYLLNTYTNEGDLVLDPFGGSGTTAIASLENHRQYILIEKDENYHAIAQSRIIHWHNDRLNSTGTHTIPSDIPRLLGDQLCLFG